MNAPFELGGLGPGVGIEQPMAVQRDAGFHKAKPERLGFCAKQQVVPRSDGPMLCQPMSGLIDTDYQSIWIRLRNERCAHAGTTERVDDERPVVMLQLLEQLLERFSGMRGAGFAPGVILVMSHNLCEVRMGTQLVG